MQASVALVGSQYRLVVTFGASTDPDGVVDHYAVGHLVNGALVATITGAASPVTIANVLPGAAHAVRVYAVDDTGDMSPPAPDVTVNVPRIPTTAAVDVVHGSTTMRGCASRATPCEIDSLARRTLDIRSSPAAWTGGSFALVERIHRTPGATRWKATHVLGGTLDASGTTRIALAARGIVPSAGSWCFRVRLPQTARTALAVSAWHCVRYRPPVTIGWAGDTTLGSATYGRPPGDGRSVFSHVRSLLRAPDMMIGNYEGTLSRGGHARCAPSEAAKCFIFQAPPTMAGGLRWAGFDVMNLANNHGLDMGAGARTQTVHALTARHVGHTGLPGEITVRRVQDTRIAMVGFAFTPGTMDLDDVAHVRRMVHAASRRADVVVACMHSGTEGAGARHVPGGDEDGRGNTRRFVHVAIDAGADLVVGSGPHVVRGVEQRRQRLAFYSSGNFAGWHNFALGGPSSESGVVFVTVDAHGRITAARFAGVELTGPGIPVPDRSGRVVRDLRSLSRADFGSHAPHIAASGSIRLR